MITRKFSKAFDKILVFFVAIAGIMVIILAIIVSLEVVLRYFFGKPTSWVVEISEYILLFIPFLVGAWVLQKEGHVKMDLFLVRLNEKNRNLAISITSFTSAIICAILTFFGIKTAIYFYQVGYKTPTVLNLPKYILISIIFIGMALLCVQFIRRFYSHFVTWNKLRIK